MLCVVFRRVEPALRACWLASLAGACLGGPRYMATNTPWGVGTGGTTPPLIDKYASTHCFTLQVGRFLGSLGGQRF